jgi:hypothetical protein
MRASGLWREARSARRSSIRGVGWKSGTGHVPSKGGAFASGAAEVGEPVDDVERVAHCLIQRGTSHLLEATDGLVVERVAENRDHVVAVD